MYLTRGRDAILNGGEPANQIKHDDGFRQFELTLDANQTLAVSATDQSGNRTARNVRVDWFNETVSAGAVATAPTLDARWLIDGEVPGDGDYVTPGRVATVKATARITQHHSHYTQGTSQSVRVRAR